MIKVLIADDSAFMRKAISMIVEKDPEIEVIDVARNGEEAIKKVSDLKPDVLTLDIEMPGMNGLEALKIIMEKHPLPVLMISSLTKENAEETLTALEIGAVDYIPKNLSFVSLDIIKLEKDIIDKIKHIARKGFIPRKNIPKYDHKTRISKYRCKEGKRKKYSIIAIGSSTGGPSALQEILIKLPSDLPYSIVIAQHMPEGFTKTFAERLNKISALTVKEAENDEVLEKSTAYIAPGNKNMTVKRKGAKVYLSTRGFQGETLHKPSVDILMESVADAYNFPAIGIILTGMGNDGLIGIKKMKKKNSFIIAQDEPTSVVYGMPKVIVDSMLADRIEPINKIAETILEVL